MHQEMHIFTVINARYMRLGLAWAKHVVRVSGENPTFICSDHESRHFLSSNGFPCEARPSSTVLSMSKRTVFGESSFPDDDAAYTVSLKLAAAFEYLADGKSVLYSDVDAIWLRNPIDDLLRYDADIIFQPGSFPSDVKEKWGFAVCTGFFYMRPCNATRTLVEKAKVNFDGSDQRTLNRVLLREFDIIWDQRPEKWEICSLRRGWTSSIHGACSKSGLRLVALPHVYYQRHGTTPETCEHAIICHPNSPKDPVEKLKILQALGIDTGIVA